MRHRAAPWQGSDHHGADITHPDRGTEIGTDLHAQHIVRALHTTKPAQCVALTALLEIAATEGQRVARQRVVHVAHGQAAGRQLDGVDDHFDALGKAAPRIDFRHARHRAQARAHGVVVQRFQFRERQRITGEHILIELTHRRRDRPQRRLHAGRQRPLGIVQPLLHQLPRKVHIDIVGERHRDQRQPELRHRPHPFGVGDAHERRFDRVRDESLHFFGRHPGSDRDDFHARAGEIGERVERDVLQRVQPGRHQAERDADDDTASMQREMDQGVHGVILRRVNDA